MGLGDVVRNLFTTAAQPLGALNPERVSGPPTSSNGASSFHLDWEMPPTPLREVSVTIEVLEPPTVAELYFWALQVNFTRGGFPVGGAHVGLQYHPSYPDGGAVNWGGYHQGGGELDGSVSRLPSALGNPNTRTFRWYAARPYRYRVFRSPNRGWRASISDLSDPSDPGSLDTEARREAGAAETIIRDLYVDADALTGPSVWSEVFAHCDHPTTAIRWSDFAAVAIDGSPVRPRGVRLNYQDYGQGGCSNTDSSIERSPGGRGTVVQRTNASRTQPSGTVLRL